LTLIINSGIVTGRRVLKEWQIQIGLMGANGVDS
jgi:hypothetical protein